MHKCNPPRTLHGNPPPLHHTLLYYFVTSNAQKIRDIYSMIYVVEGVEGVEGIYTTSTKKAFLKLFFL